MSNLSNQARAIANQLNVIHSSIEMLADSQGFNCKTEAGADAVLLEEFRGIMNLFAVQLEHINGQFYKLEKNLKRAKTKAEIEEEELDQFLENGGEK